MTKTDFLEILRRNISQVNDYNYVNECIDYYDTYINTQINNGKAEGLVMEELGDPKLIAKSIVTSRLQTEPEDEADTKRNKDDENYRCIVINGRNVMVPKWVLKILTLVVIVLLLLLVGTIAGFVFPFVVIYFLIRIIVRNIFKK